MKYKINHRFSILRMTCLLVFIILINDFQFAQTIEVAKKYGKLEVKILGFENNEGDCWFALDNSKEVYESEDEVWIGKILSIKNKQVIVVIDSLEYGEYAIRVFHDENKNGELDTDFLGIPDEDYGYSNDASGFFGPPSWEKAKFYFNKPEMTITINID